MLQICYFLGFFHFEIRLNRQVIGNKTVQTGTAGTSNTIFATFKLLITF